MASHSNFLPVRWQKDMTLADEPPSSEGVQYATGEEQRAVTSSSRMNEETGPKQKLSAVDVSGGENKESACNAGNLWFRKILWRKELHSLHMLIRLCSKSFKRGFSSR